MPEQNTMTRLKINKEVSLKSSLHKKGDEYVSPGTKEKTNMDLHKMMSKFKRKINKLNQDISQMKEDAEEIQKSCEY
jgi:predicted  nucleic acid-binding Zn-ribbon protein